jgi:hypothetical protein
MDTYMVRQGVKRIVDELESNSFIKEPKEENLNENSGGHITNLARRAGNGGSIGYGCGAVGKVLSCTIVKGSFGGRRGQNQKISGSSLTSE